MTTSVLDTALDLSVPGGYTNVGYLIPAVAGVRWRS